MTDCCGSSVSGTGGMGAQGLFLSCFFTLIVLIARVSLLFFIVLTVTMI